jgi:hypothetical protein
MSLQNSGGTTYPLPFTWSNSCSGNSGQATFTANWQSRLMTSTNNQCATLISLQGDGSSQVTLRYYGQ